MSRRYEVIWAGIAENDLREIIEYIAIDNPTNNLAVHQAARTSWPVTAALHSFNPKSTTPQKPDLHTS